MLTVLLAAVLTTSATWSCEDEDARVTQHLEDALVQLQTATPPGLSNEQREARAGLLRDLRRYIDAHEFPRNDGPVTPVFVDDDEHHCAMGALLAWNGGEHLVRSIREKRNLATVPTLVDEPGLGEWLTAHGMTVEEAALVQPGYYSCTPTLEVCFRAREPQLWVANGSETPNSITYSTSATRDGVCAAPTGRWPVRDLPPGTIHALQSGLVPIDDDTYVHASWAKCRNPLRIKQSALNEATPEGCMRALVANDERAVLPSCGDGFNTVQFERCGADGRFLAEALPAYGVQQSLERMFLEPNQIDAGLPPIDFAALEAAAWAHSTDGGTVPAGDVAQLLTWDGTNPAGCVLLDDGGVVNTAADAGTGAVQKPALPDPVEFPLQPRGCSTVAGLGLALTALLLRRRR